MSTRAQYYPLGGGLDVVTPALSVKPGRLLSCINFEPHYNDGYRRIDGYERFDGRPRPHLQDFYGLELLDATGLTVGTVLTGDTSGATGEVVAISGNYVGLSKYTGDFTVSELVNSGAYQLATLTPGEGVAPDATTEDTFRLAAQDDYRDDIAVVPGSGEVRGIWRLRDVTYAIRNNAGATAGILHKASSSGWTTTGITMAHYLKFNNGTDTPGPVWQVGDTVTGASSGASATIHKIVDWAGSYSGGDATGYLVLTGVTGGPFTSGENLQVGGVTDAVANGNSAQYAFSINGEYRFISHNFFGSSTSFRAYGVNGVDDAFEIDENGIVSPIIIPTVADLTGVASTLLDIPSGAPFLIEEHKNHLFLAFPGGRVVHSSVGEPLNFSGFLSAAEFGLGEEVTGLNSVVGGVLIMTTERNSQGLYGNDITDWDKRLIGQKTGGKLYSTQKLDTVYTLDDLGISSIARTDNFGDFVGATVSQLIAPTVNALRDKVTDSTVVRKLNQVRWYFNDNTALIMFVPSAGAVNESRGTQTALNVQFGTASYPFAINRIFNCEDELEEERTFFASTDGFVYEDLVGNNFDGAELESYARTVFYHMGSPSWRKRFRRLDIELSGQRSLAMKVQGDLSYGATEFSSSLADVTTSDIPESTVLAGGGFWDTSNWDEFYWDGQNIATARVQLRGTGENIGFLFYHSSATTPPFVLQGLTVHYDRRRLQR